MNFLILVYCNHLSMMESTSLRCTHDQRFGYKYPHQLSFKLSYPFHSFIHSDHFYSAPPSPLLLRDAPDYSTDTVSEFHAKVHRQLQVKDLPKVPMWWLERESNPRPSG